MVQLPEEIIRHILEYNVNHRILFKPTLERIATAAALMKYHVINNAWNKIILEGVELPFPDFLMSSKYIINFNEYVKALIGVIAVKDIKQIGQLTFMILDGTTTLRLRPEWRNSINVNANALAGICLAYVVYRPCPIGSQ